jgi:peptide/nickel transport system permease protein
MACASVIGIPLAVALGFTSGLTRLNWLDRTLSTAAVLVGSLPEFVIAMLVILLLSQLLGLLPPTSWNAGDAWPFESPKTVVLPALTLVLLMLAYILRVTRASVKRVMAQEYIIAAEIKRLPRRTVWIRHVAPNALLPTITVAAAYVGWMMGGLVVVEAVYTYPGLGLLVLSAAKSRDVPLLEAAVLLAATFRMTVNFAADILYRIVDPRVRLA